MAETIDTHLEAALQEATDETARYHIRQALQLRVVEQESQNDGLSV
ncbi:hypothetical protein [Haloarcula laminariae]|nr:MULTISPECIES: hypothetical protein [Halomicroarcula]